MKINVRFLKLKEVIERLDDLDDSLYIYIEPGNLSLETKAALISMEAVEENKIQPPMGMEYLLEIDIAKDVVRAWSFHRGGKVPSLDDKVTAIFYYAEHDAYLPVE